MKIKENNKCSYCTDTVDVIEHFSVECQVVRHFWNCIEGTILRECGINVKLHLIDVITDIIGLECKDQIEKKTSLRKLTTLF